MQRAQRKLEHIRYALELEDGPVSTHFEDIRFLHNCLPEIAPADIRLSGLFLGKPRRLPFLIDAVTGGIDAVAEINAALAQAAQRAGVALAVGSQYGAVREAGLHASYETIRRHNPAGHVFANNSALATPQEAKTAVEMLAADALEIHLNPAQELVMPEGDKNFRGLLENMLRIREALSVPIIIKETGCGIAAEEYRRLTAAGFYFFNCAGAGGTNFPAIEARRGGRQLENELANWGIPTSWSLLDACSVCETETTIIASGGIRTAAQAAKAFALGADLVACAAPVLRLAAERGAEAAADFLENLGQGLAAYMLLLGCREVAALRAVPLVFAGTAADFLASRGYNAALLSQKRR